MEAASAAADAPPAAYSAAAAHAAACKQAAASGAPAPAPPFARGSEAFWWHELLRAVPAHRSVYAGTAPIISRSNLSRTAREEAEMRGVVRWEDWGSAEEAVLTAPGAGVRLHGLTQDVLNGRLGRVLPLEGPGAPADAPAPGRVAVRLAGASGRVLAVKAASLSPAFVLSGPKKTAGPRAPPAGAAARASKCVRFVDAPVPPEAPTAVWSIGFTRQPPRSDLYGAQLECHFLSVAGGVPECDARRLMDVGSAIVNAWVQRQVEGVVLSADEFVLLRCGHGANVSLAALLAAGVAEDTGRTLTLPGEQTAAAVLRCLLPLPPSERNTSGNPLAEAMAQMFPNMPSMTYLIVNNPTMPCAFELGWPADAEWGMQVEPQTHAFDPPEIQRAHWSSPAAAKAAAKALIALVVSPEETPRYTDEALAVCAHCGDAWTARAMKCSKTLEEALEMYRRAVQEATAALAPELLEEVAETRGLTVAQREAQDMRELWLVHPLRPLVRAMTGLACTLRKLRRWGEAADAFMALQAHDPKSYSGNTFWINVRAPLAAACMRMLTSRKPQWKTCVPETLLAAGRTAEARAYMIHPDNVTAISWTSSGNAWMAAAAALDAAAFLKLPAAAKWPGEAFVQRAYANRCPDMHELVELEARGSRDRIPGGVLTGLVCHRSLGVAWLLGLPEAPPAPVRHIGPILEGEGKEPAAMASWALQGTREALEAAVPGFMALLRRMHRTVVLHGWLSGESIVPIPAELPMPDTATGVAWVEAGEVFINARYGFATLLSHAARSKTAGVELTRAFLAAGANPCCGAETHGMAPLMQWACYGGPLATGKLLIQHGCPTGDHDEHLFEYASMSANQCTGLQLSVLLPKLQVLARAARANLDGVQEDILRSVLCSTVPGCLESKGAEPCQRCVQRDMPHAATASFARTMGAFVSAGVIDLSIPGCFKMLRDVCGSGGCVRELRRWETTQGAALKRRDATACAFCGERGGRRCGRCKAVRFCDDDCAAAAWPTHKAACNAAKKT